MTPDERNTLIEIKTDVKWLIENALEHRQTHSNYLYCLVATFIAAIVGWFKGS